MKTRRAIALAFMGAILSGGGNSAAFSNTEKPIYSIKPSDVIPPSDVPLGQYRRSFTPFGNWTLVCDENMHAKSMVCNVSQAIIDQTGKVVFSWSLAAAKGGRPYMILRTGADIRLDAGIMLSFTGVKNRVKVPFEGCNKTVCLGKTPVGPVLSQHIGKGGAATITYHVKAGQIITMTLPLKGLKEAVASLK